MQARRSALRSMPQLWSPILIHIVRTWVPFPEFAFSGGMDWSLECPILRLNHGIASKCAVLLMWPHLAACLELTSKYERVETS